MTRCYPPHATIIFSHAVYVWWFCGSGQLKAVWVHHLNELVSARNNEDCAFNSIAETYRCLNFGV
jgi:hypothetical protein